MNQEFKDALIKAIKVGFAEATEKAFLWAMSGEGDIAHKYFDIAKAQRDRLAELESE